MRQIKRKRLAVALVVFLLFGSLIASIILVIDLEVGKTHTQEMDVAHEFGDEQATTFAQAVLFALHASRYLSVSRLVEAMQLYEQYASIAPAGAALSMGVFYGGKTVAFYPSPASVELLLPNISQLDTLSAFPASLRDKTVEGMTTGRTVVADIGFGTPMLLVPVFMNATSASETWGWPSHMTVEGCLDGTLPCYDATTGRKWWGQVGFTLGQQELYNCSAIQQLNSSGYGYRLSLVTSAAEQPSDTVLFTNLDELSCASPLTQSFSALTSGLQVVVEVCYVDGWEIKWQVPVLVIVVVVLVGVLLVMTYFAITWLRHSTLMRTLLSAHTIQHLARTLEASPAQQTPKLEGEAPTGTPSERLNAVLGQLLAGTAPCTADVVQLIVDLKQQADLYVPADLEEHLTQAAGMDGEVAAALMASLSPQQNNRRKSQSIDLMRTNGSLMGTGMSSGHQHGLMCPEEDGYEDVTDALHSLTGIVRDVPVPGAAFLSTGNPLAGWFDAIRAPALSLQQSRLSVVFSEADPNEIMVTSRSIRDSFALGMQTSNASNTQSPQPSPMTQLEIVLASASSLGGDFDVWQLAEASEGHPLSALGYWCFHQSGVLQELGIPTRPLVRFLRACDQGYEDNPYHNRTHAADVLQSVHALMHAGGLRGTYADSSMTVAACYLAAIIHDYNHRGFTNDFLVATKHELAIRYNDRSPHENHHLGAGFSLLNQPQNNFLAHLPLAAWASMRKLMIDLVLATDMKQHFAINGAFATIHRVCTATLVQQITQKCSSSLSPQRTTADEGLSSKLPVLSHMIQSRVSTSRGSRLQSSGGQLVPPTSNEARGLELHGRVSKATSDHADGAEKPQRMTLNGGVTSLHRLANTTVVKNKEDVPSVGPIASPPRVGARPSSGASSSELYSHPKVASDHQLPNLGSSAGVSSAGDSPKQLPPLSAMMQARLSLAHSRRFSLSSSDAGGAARVPSSSQQTALMMTSNDRDTSTYSFQRPSVNKGRVSQQGLLHNRPRGSPAPVDEAERLLGLQMMLKCSDLGHICTSLDVHLQWVAALEEEMFLQGDKEREAGLPISPLCDRTTIGVTKSQIGFFEVVVLPLLTNFTARFANATPILDAATANYHYWQAQARLAAQVT